MHVYRRASEPIRTGLTTEERWLGSDHGVVAAWERGREIAGKSPEIADRVKAGQLPILPWKGGVERALKGKEKFGTLRYLAMWRGLRGEDLDIHLDKEYSLICSVTGQRVVYTGDLSKYAGQGEVQDQRESNHGSVEPAY